MTSPADGASFRTLPEPHTEFPFSVAIDSPETIAIIAVIAAVAIALFVVARRRTR